MNPLTRYGGIVAGIILIAFGVGSTLTGVNGRSEVRDTLKQERIVGTPDMDKPIASKPVDTGAKAKLFAEGMREHTLAATDGQVYSQMAPLRHRRRQADRRQGRRGHQPEDRQPEENAARNIWVTETALATALDTSFFAERVAMFAIVMGVALLLVGHRLSRMLLGPVGRGDAQREPPERQLAKPHTTAVA